MANLSSMHFKAIDRIWKYLVYTPELGIRFSSNKQSAPYILGYADADYGGDIIGRKSTIGYYFSFKKAPIS